MGNDSNSSINLNLWSLAWPIGLEMLLIYSIGFIDVFFLSLVSMEAAAAFGAIQAVMAVIIMLFKQMAQGGGSVAAQFLGAKNKAQANHTFTAILIINTLLGVVVALGVYLVHPFVGGWLGASDEISTHISTYLSIVGPALLFMAVRFGYSAIAASLGKTRWNLASSIVSNIVNVVLNTLLVVGLFGFPKLGVQGVAIATAVAYFVYLLVLMFNVHRNSDYRFSLSGDAWMQFRKRLRPIMRIAIPSTMEPILFNGFQLVLTILVIEIGDLALAARTFVLQISTFILLWSFSIAQANQIITAHHVGNERFDLADKDLKRNTVIGIIGSIAVTLIVIAFSEPILGIFTGDADVIKLCTALFFLGLVMEPSRSVNMIVVFSLGASGDAMFSAKLGLIASWFFALPLAYFLGIYLGYGLIGIWVAMILEEALRACLNYIRWTRAHWQNCRVLSSIT